MRDFVNRWMTMTLYAKTHAGTKRQALEKLPYGSASTPPEHVLELVTPSQDGHRMSTTPHRERVAR